MSKLDFNVEEEKRLVDEVFSNAMAVLSDEDRQIPQVQSVLPLLRRGIGIHHGGWFYSGLWNQLHILYTDFTT